MVDELIRGGVRDVVLCPGSRNAPLAFALHDADRAGAHDVVQKDGRFGDDPCGGVTLVGVRLETT